MIQPARRIYLVRHGATEANLRRPYALQGQRSDLPLTELGHRQAQAAAGVLAAASITAVFSSPLTRARETAEILAAPNRIAVRSVPSLTECDVGRWEGLSWEIVRAQDPELWAAFDAEPGTAPYAGGESFQQVQDRAVPAIRQLIRDDSHGDIVVVTHNVVARVILAHVIGLGIDKARGIRVDYGGISILAASDDRLNVMTLNSIFHLTGLLVE